MEDSIVIQIIQTAMILTIQVSTPVLAVGIIVGLLISIFQSVTQIQESTLTFVPKLFCGIITFIIVFVLSDSSFQELIQPFKVGITLCVTLSTNESRTGKNTLDNSFCKD